MMKSRTRLQPNNQQQKPLNVDSKAKIYVPISINNQNHNSGSTSQIHFHENNATPEKDTLISELKRVNMDLKQKQEIYIDKLLKLEEGLEKQHIEFKQLQDLYHQLLHSYKRKEEEIAQLEQRYRESNRKKESLGVGSQIFPHNAPLLAQSQLKQPQPQQKKQSFDQKQAQDRLQQQLQQQNTKVAQLSKTIQRLFLQNTYYKNKDKMNDSRASLNSKVFQELEEWQKQVDIQREEKIKLDYENRFLKNRNQDLENRIAQLQKIVVTKQSEVVNLRQNNILLTRENSENRLLRSTSRSPRKNQDKQQDKKSPDQTSKTNRVISQLYEQIKALKKELEAQKSRNIHHQNELFIKQQQFYSFSQDHSNHSSNQSQPQKNKLHKQLFIKIENNQIETDRSKNENQEQFRSQIGPNSKKFGMEGEEHEQVPHFAEINQSYESLQELPAELEIDNLILKNMKKGQAEF